MKNGKRILSVTIRYMLEQGADSSYLDQDEFGERKRQFEAGLFDFIGIRADAEIAIPTGPELATIQHIRSGGLWGIESDSDKTYLASIETEELSALKTQLIALGFSTRAISKAFQNIERKD